jgi:cytochrome P450
MVKLSNKMVKQKWWRGGVRDVYMDFNELTIEIVASALFGASEVSEDMVEVGAAISSAFQFFTRSATSMFIVPEWFPTIDNLQYKAAVTRLDNVVYRLIAERRSELASSSAPAHQDLLTRLLQVQLCYLFDLRTLYMITCMAKEKF